MLPKIPGQKWSCHQCGLCCRHLVGHITEEERRRLDEQEWIEKLGVEPYVRIGRSWALNKRPDGSCVFLEENNLCRIHREFGEEAKPLACRIFPFSVRPVQGAWQASFRFDCPSSTSSKGKPIERHQGWLTTLVRSLPSPGSEVDPLPMLPGGLRATQRELNALIDRLLNWFHSSRLPLSLRLYGAARISTALGDAKYGKVREVRFLELLDTMFDLLSEQWTTMPQPASSRMMGLLRQLVFAHAEHVTLGEKQNGIILDLRKRWSQLRAARKFRKGRGIIPSLPDLQTELVFEDVERVTPPIKDAAVIAHLLLRYISARLTGRSFAGEGYYGWPLFLGLNALWMSIAAAGWLARHHAAAQGRTEVAFDDAAHAIGIVDRAATRLPALGSVAERVRLAYLAQHDGIARLIQQYALTVAQEDGHHDNANTEDGVDD